MSRDAIAELVHRYADAVVHRDEAQWAATWATDAVWELGKGRRVEGREAIVGLWNGAMDTFKDSPEFMESAVSLVVGITAEEEAIYKRVGRTQQWFYEQLLIAESDGDLLLGTDCLQLSQLLAASQWGCTLLWQKGLISLAELREQTLLKHCLDMTPYCTPQRKRWLEEIKTAIRSTGDQEATTVFEKRKLAAVG